MIVTIRKAQPDDPILIIPHLRERDAERLGELGDPLQLIYDGISTSFFSFTGEIDGEIAALWGARCTTIFDDSAYIWMLGTTLIDRHPTVFLRHSRRALRALTARFRLIYGQIDCDFETSVRWLKWLGADIKFHDKQLVFKI